MVTIYTASLTFNNFTFCPHSVFMCFVWISEQTAIISLYNNDGLFAALLRDVEKECLMCRPCPSFVSLSVAWCYPTTVHRTSLTSLQHLLTNRPTEILLLFSYVNFHRYFPCLFSDLCDMRYKLSAHLCNS